MKIDYTIADNTNYHYTRMLTGTPNGGFLDSDSYIDRPTGAFSMSNHKSSAIALTVNSTEMLKVTEDGFYVRGVKIPVDQQEAETVYNAFKQFLVWAELNRR